MRYTNATVAFRPATEKQITFLNTLRTERVLPENLAAALGAALAANALTTRTASGYIDECMRAPKKPPVLIPAADRTELDNLLAQIPSGHYAVPMDDVRDWLTDTNTDTNDYLFVGVRRWKNSIFIERLSGSYGGYRHTRIGTDDRLTLAKFLADADRQRDAVQTFGRIHNECGKCGAALTDPVSRSLFIGPTCRKAYSL